MAKEREGEAQNASLAREKTSSVVYFGNCVRERDFTVHPQVIRRIAIDAMTMHGPKQR